jgi:hypothetical protein
VKLIRLYNLIEAGILGGPTSPLSKKRSPFKQGSPFRHTDGAQPDDGDDDEDDLDPDTDHDDLTPEEPDDEDDLGEFSDEPDDIEDDEDSGDDEDVDDDEDDLGPDMDYDDPTPEEPDDEPEPPPKPEKEPEKEVPFTAQPAKPSPALRGGKTVGTVIADKATLGALQRALENVRTRDDDLQDWIDDVIREISRAMRTGGELTLPKFEATPDLDSFDEDDGGYEDEDF